MLTRRRWGSSVSKKRQLDGADWNASPDSAVLDLYVVTRSDAPAFNHDCHDS